MMFLIVNTVTVTLSGSRWKHVVCDQCREPYHFPVTKTTTETGQTVFWLFVGSVKRGVERTARKKLDALLESDASPCTCPSCGAYQRSMFRRLADGRFKWMGWAAAACLPLWIATECVILSHALPSSPNYTPEELAHNRLVSGFACLLTLAWLFAAAGILIGCHARRWRYDPNAAITHDQRLDEARRQAWTDSEYETEFGAEKLDRVSGADQAEMERNPSSQVTGLAMLFGMAIGAGVGGVLGYDQIGSGWTGMFCGGLLGVLPGFFAGLIVGLIAKLLLRSRNGAERDQPTEGDG